MLQSVQTEISEVRSLRMAEDTEYTALVVEMVVEELDLKSHTACILEPSMGLTPGIPRRTKLNIGHVRRKIF
jgi:hypothetical protein